MLSAVHISGELSTSLVKDPHLKAFQFEARCNALSRYDILTVGYSNNPA